MNKTANVIGAGLAGCEAAWQLANRGITVNMYDIKPDKFTPAHNSYNFCELVCSNSLKSNEITNACGLLKQEMRELNSLVIKCADNNAVPAGNALAVDRNLFAAEITAKIKENTYINVICKEVTKIPEGVTIIATGPLTSPLLLEELNKICKGSLYFFDAAAPIIDGATIDYNKSFAGNRYNKGISGTDDYINCPLTKEEYYNFVNELACAQRAKLKDYENVKVFEGCVPVEILAKRGIDTLRYGPLKPVGLKDKDGNMPYAAMQLRRESTEGKYYNMVGFQTNLLFGEQKRVFSLIPALKQAEFVKYGVMHKNAYINSPAVLDKSFMLKQYKGVFIAGQLCGVEGYVESASSGLSAAINAYMYLSKKDSVDFTAETVTGALANYITAQNANFQPMNANFAIIKPLYPQVRNKRERYNMYASRAIEKITQIKHKFCL